MESTKEPQLEEINKAELERAVEITILQREIEKIEQNIKRSFRLKPYIAVTIMGAILGAIFTFLEVTSDNLEEDTQVSNYINNCKYPSPIVSKYANDRFHLWELTSESGTLVNDTAGVYRFSQKEIAQTYAGIDKKIKEIQQRIAVENRVTIFKGAAIGAAILPFFFLLVNSMSVFFGKQAIIRHRLKLNEIGAKELKQNLNAEGEKDFFTQLVQINFKYLDQYYLQTQEQADKSFWISAIASIVGFLMIISGVILIYVSSKTDPGYVATSAGVISEFIAAVFFYLYNRTIMKMSQYHQKLVITQNISLALKTADLLTESKERVLESLIERLTTDVNKHLSNS